MAQSASGNVGSKSNEFDSIVERCYQTHFADGKDLTLADFYRAVCETVEEINKKLGSTQFNVPKTTTLKLVFKKHQDALKNVTEKVKEEVATDKATEKVGEEVATDHKVAEKVTDEVAKDKSTEKVTDEKLMFTKEMFEEVLQEVVVESGFSAGFGAKDMLTYIFGIPMTALLIKQRFGPKTIPNDLFIPAITSATVFLLAKLQKI
ncbi:hypothetical protein SLEP1_g48372 [Rubroshorea leprosula]|uniref:Uncharacterized protein n=1 Tax=Rubroshorea leprosula TaxID=152421 RepID=A0AAV5LUK2_9ROSI|nr:hypothetical protein SLEP1_g48372 [Rubroshorea leprosula]